jgi:hypothetical protein
MESLTRRRIADQPNARGAALRPGLPYGAAPQTRVGQPHSTANRPPAASGATGVDSASPAFISENSIPVACLNRAPRSGAGQTLPSPEGV